MPNAQPDMIAAAVAAEMDRRGMTQSELAALAGVPQPKISLWLRGRAFARSDTIERILAVLRLRISRAR